MPGCLDDDAIAAYIDGALPPHEIARVDTHIDECATCRGDLSAMAIAHGSEPLAAGSTDPGEPLGELAPGDTIGRYVVLHEHARGGMGVVAVATDPELERKVAIKVLRTEISQQIGEGAQHLRDEARAMASLSHPNVVSVHDVGTHAGRIFLAMELVDGVSLRAWLAIETRSWRAVVGACIAAGRGLAAAHRVGLVHRDFKPDNVLCGPGDRVRVTDFGLARHDGVTVARSKVRTGMAGTPRYMAPEVWRGDPATARSDQWSFCVTLYEALYGKPPFDAETPRELGVAVQTGVFAFPPRPSIPARVTRAIQRGLRTAAADRFDSLDALLAELDRSLRRAATPWLIAAAAVVVAGVVTVVALSRGGGGDGELCAMPDTLLAGTWDASRKTALESAFAASGRNHAPETARRVTEILDGYTSDWFDARRDACVATRTRGDQSDAVLEARTRCLDRRRDELAALVSALSDRPRPEVIDRAVQATRELYPIATCSVEGVRTEQPVPQARALLIADLDRELATVHASQLVAQVDRMVARGRGLVERAKALGYPPQIARATHEYAVVSAYSTDHTAIEANLFAAIEAAAAAHDDNLAAESWMRLVMFCAQDKGDPALALTHARSAEVAILRADSPKRLRSAFYYARGIAYVMHGDHAEGKADFEQSLALAEGKLEIANSTVALCNVENRLGRIKVAADLCWRAVALYEAELGPTHPRVGFTLLNAGHVIMQQHDLPRARDVLVRALAILRGSVGEQHVAYALALNNLGLVEVRLEDIAGARRDFERALALLDAIKHPEALQTRMNLGNLERQLGNPAGARKYWNQALAMAEATRGKDSELVGQIWGEFGALEVDEGHLDKAEAAYRHALAIAEKHFGQNHPNTTQALDGLGFVYSDRGDCKTAITYQSRAVAAAEAVHGPDDRRVAETLTTLAACQAKLHDRTALANLERALDLHDRSGVGPPFEPAATRWTYAQALITFGGDKTRAVELAQQARALYAKSSQNEAAKVLPVIDRWLAARK
ncbi:MAG: tetratricopeptide repeat protein [Kofleriaceae bacterium]